MNRLSALALVICLAAGGCSKPAAPELQGDIKTIDAGLRVRDLVERELMLVDETLQMQALDGAIGARDVAPQLGAAAQQLLGAPISDAARDKIVADHKAATQIFFGYVDVTVDHTADPQWRAFAAGRMDEIRAAYADDMTKGFDPGPELSNAYVMLARSRGVQGGTTVTPFDNAEADAARLLPTSPNLPPPPSAQPVMPVGGR